MLPSDIYYKILNNLEDKDLVMACQTNQKYNEICNDQTFWLNRIVTKYPMIPTEILREFKGNRTWSDYYIYDLRKINPRQANRTLVRAAKEGRLDLVILALALGADIHTMNDKPLRDAASRGNFEVVEYLINNGANQRVIGGLGQMWGRVKRNW